MVLAIRQAMLTVVARKIKPAPQDCHVFEPLQTLPLTRRFDDLEEREIVKSVVQARGSEQAAANRTSLVQSEQQDLSVAIGETIRILTVLSFVPKFSEEQLESRLRQEHVERLDRQPVLTRRRENASVVRDDAGKRLAVL